MAAGPGPAPRAVVPRGDLGFAVLGPAASCREALTILEQEQPDAGLLDVRLIDGNAGPIAARLKADGVPFAVITAWSADAIADPLLCEAPQVNKPFGLNELERVMLALLARG